jgi:hypothetical protein
LLIQLTPYPSHYRTAFPLDFYTDPSPAQLAPYLESHSTFLHRARYSSLNEKILEIIDDFSLVSFETLAVEDKESMWRLVRLVDKVGGWVFVHAGEMDLGGASSGVGSGDEDEDEEEQMPSQMRAALEERYLDGNKVSSSISAGGLSLRSTHTLFISPAIRISGLCPLPLHHPRLRRAPRLGISRRRAGAVRRLLQALCCRCRASEWSRWSPSDDRGRV